MFLTKLLKLITIIALCAAMAWFVFEPGFEPAITFIVILAAILKLFWDEIKEKGLAQTVQDSVLTLDGDPPKEKQTPSADPVNNTSTNENATAYPGGSFTGSDYSGMDMSGHVSKKADYRGARFAGTNLAGAHLKGSNFENADFKGANLSRAYLKGANLKGANLDDADLSGATLIKANLRGASIKNTKLTGANMKKTIMPGPVARQAPEPDAGNTPAAVKSPSAAKD